MTVTTNPGGAFRPGFRTLTCLVLLAGSLAGLYLLDRQIEVFGFGAQGPDARTLPRIVLWVLTAALLARLAVSWRTPDVYAGPPRRVLRVLIVIATTITALWLMPRFGFFPGAVVAGISVTLSLGERRLLLVVGVPLILATAVFLGGRNGLNIPLP